VLGARRTSYHFPFAWRAGFAGVSASAGATTRATARDRDAWTHGGHHMACGVRVRGEQHGHIDQDRHIGGGHRTVRQQRSA
jgi:hypothetical protein